MRLYLSAESKNNIGYTPDWLRVTYEEDGQNYELTLDIQGTIDYEKECLSCRCKGDLVPWTLLNCETGNEMDLSSLSEDEIDIKFPNKRIAEIIRSSNSYEIGIYPVNDDEETFELAERDILSDCSGLLEMYIDENHYYEINFQFNVDLNVY